MAVTLFSKFSTFKLGFVLGGNEVPSIRHLRKALNVSRNPKTDLKPEIRLYKSPWRAIKIILLCSVFVIPALLLWGKEDFPQWVNYMSILFFGLGYPVGLFQLLDRRPQIIINETGIFDRTAFRAFINWGIIEDAYLKDVHDQKFICLVLKDKFIVETELLIKRTKLSKAFGFQALNISLGQIQIDENKLMEFIIAMSKADLIEREGLLKNDYRLKGQ